MRLISPYRLARTLRFLVPALLLVSCARLLGAGQERQPTGPHAVARLDFPDLHDAARGDRREPITVHYPRDLTTPAPVIVYSHGGGGSRQSHLYEAQHMASHGYVALCLEHVYSNSDALKAGARRARGTLKQRLHASLKAMTRDPRAVLQRPRDVSFALDVATRWDREHATLKGRLDLDRVAVAGHSFGAYTTQVICGARPIKDHLDPAPGYPETSVGPGKGRAESMADPRVDLGIAMSPQGLGTSRFGAGSFATVHKPMLCISGSEDTQFGHDGSTLPALRRLEGWRMMPAGAKGGAKYMAWLENADHLAFADNPKAWLLPSRARADAMKVVYALTLAMCDAAFREGDVAKAARDKLSQAYVDTLTGDVVTRIRWHARE